MFIVLEKWLSVYDLELISHASISNIIGLKCVQLIGKLFGWQRSYIKSLNKNDLVGLELQGGLNA